jgi:uncharacterized LabA/DUF88 family protein
MAKNSNNTKNFAFIDAQNLYLGVKRQGWDLDYARFRIYLRDKYNITKAFLFIGFVPENQDLYKTLQENGFICVFKPVLPIKNKITGTVTYKGNVDAELVLEAATQLSHYDKAVIVTSDGDFACLIKYLKNNNKLEKVITTHTKYSRLLKQFSDYLIPISLIKDKIKKGHSRKP